MDFTIRYFRDDEIDENLDLQLRALLLECFPHEAQYFNVKRYLHENPQNRWLAFDENGVLAAHVAAHEKIIGAGEADLKVLGIAEVAVSPQFRGRGLVKAILEQVHAWGKEHDFAFSTLGGRSEIYSSSGYVNTTNPVTVVNVSTGQNVTEKLTYFMVRPLNNQVWPEGEIDVRGPMF